MQQLTSVSFQRKKLTSVSIFFFFFHILNASEFKTYKLTTKKKLFLTENENI